MAHVVTTPAQPLYLGTSGWAYASWKPGFYPAKLPAREFLKAYSARLNSVEVNYTFRMLPKAKLLEDWLAATPEGFRFSFKAPQRITHILRLRGCEAEMVKLTSVLQPVVAAKKMGVVLMQFPPNFRAMSQGKDKWTNLEALGEFLAAMREQLGKQQLRMAFEFRDTSWFCEETYARLREHGAALCVAESDALMTPEVPTADFAYYRLRQSEYSEAKLGEIYARLEGAAGRGEVFGYFKHEETPDGALQAEELLQRWQRKHGIGVGPA
jgi:uncharacterized protein YecE (DUF72 family)